MSFDQTNSENSVFGIRISVKNVDDGDIVFPRRKKRAIALIEFSLVERTLRLGFHRPVIGRYEIIPLIINYKQEYEVEDPKKIALTIASRFGIPNHHSFVILRVAKLMAGHAIDQYLVERHANRLFGGGPVAFQDQGQPDGGEGAEQHSQS